MLLCYLDKDIINFAFCHRCMIVYNVKTYSHNSSLSGASSEFRKSRQDKEGLDAIYKLSCEKKVLWPRSLSGNSSK